jgi:hypothetical protein
MVVIAPTMIAAPKPIAEITFFVDDFAMVAVSQSSVAIPTLVSHG